MILIDDAKYSCLECIRGHRSSRCKHQDRPLLQVRSKGRPNVHANGNPNHRIAVFAEEVASRDTDDQTFAGQDPVVILKTSSKKVMDLTSGSIIGPFIESKQKKESGRPPPPVVNSGSFINTSTCCSVKKQKTCACSHNHKRNVNKSQIVKTYLKKKMAQNSNSRDMQWTFVDYLNNDQKSDSKMEADSAGDDKYCVLKIPSCSLPGSCCCDESCTCAGCTEHNNSSKSAANEISTLAYEEFIKNRSEKAENKSFDSILDGPFREKNTTALPINDNSSTSTTSAPDCLEFPIMKPLQFPEYNALDEQSDTGTDFTQHCYESPSFDISVCQCPPDKCECTNCETHGIINGFKLDDFFGSNMENKNLSQLFAQYGESGL